MDADVVVVGGGIGGMCAAAMLGAAGRSVVVLERAAVMGGKAGSEVVDGVEFDTGPSVLTLPFVFDEVFAAVGLCREDELQLIRSSPAFRYVYADGMTLDVSHEVEETIASIERALGSVAAREMRDYLTYARRIWEAAAPHFVMSEAPSLSRLLFGGVRAMSLVARIDPFRSLKDAIRPRVKTPHLVMLLERYATYNGSDPRRVPATLGCIAHVELELGGYGVRGGMRSLVHALERVLSRARVEVRLGTEVSEIAVRGDRVQGVRTVGGDFISCPQVVVNADVAHLVEGLLPRPSGLGMPDPPSMSAYCSVFRAVRTDRVRVPHTVLFPENYEAEFEDVFDRRRPPSDPTVYLCAQEACHDRRGWADAEPVFSMTNAPFVGPDFSGEAGDVFERVREKLIKSALLEPEDQAVWQRTPRDLASTFPGSKGAIYGAASHGISAAFRRPENHVRSIRGLYLASGSAHPGGGVPMVAQSGKLAALAALARSRKDRAA